MLSLEKQNQFREEYRRQHPQWLPATEVFAAQVRATLRADSRVLDIGCGRGGLLEQLVHPLTQVIGLDPDWESLHGHRLPELPRTAGWSDALPFAAETFDLIFASWVLEHLSQPEQTLAAVARVMRSGGHFVFITPNGRHPLALANRLLGGLGRLQGWLVAQVYGRAAADTFPTFYRANSHCQLDALARSTQMELVYLQAIPDPTYLAFSSSLFWLSRRLEQLLPASRHIHLVGVMRRGEAQPEQRRSWPRTFPVSVGDEV